MPGPGEVIIAVSAADVPLLDAVIRSGRAVIARTGGGGGSGGYVEQARVTAGQLVAVPDGVSLPEAAAILHDGATALGLAASTGIRPREQVLILGAADAHLALETRSAVGKTLLTVA